MFTVAPERQGVLIARLQDATEQLVRHQRDCVSSNIHTNVDGTQRGVGPGSDPKPRTPLRCACAPTCGNIADMIEVLELTQPVRRDVLVRSPRRSGLTKVLTSMGATVLAEPGHGLSVTGMDACRITSVARHITYRSKN